jgi:hypothetical protein
MKHQVEQQSKHTSRNSDNEQLQLHDNSRGERFVLLLACNATALHAYADVMKHSQQ